MSELLAENGLFFLMSFSISAILTPCIIWLSKKFNLVAPPRQDRWHKKPTALLGGIAIFTAFFAPFATVGPHTQLSLVLLVSCLLFFLVGLIDDLKELSPQGKFLAQLAISSFMVAGGFRLEVGGPPAVSIILTIFWITALTNAFNILDNMDGLCSGIAMVSATSFFAFSYINHPDPILLGGSALLAGATLGFFIYNFNPARIFMGDCGSLFIGSVLAVLSILTTWQENSSSANSSGIAGPANMILVLLVPISILIVPIFDTALVSLARTQNGRPIYLGGKDHTSHRLVLLGLTEPKTVLLLMLWAALVSGTTIILLRHSLEGLFVTLALTGILALFFAIFLIHHTRNVYSESTHRALFKRNSIVNQILNKKQMLQALLDTLLISLAYIASYLLRFEGRIDPHNMHLIEISLPMIIGIKITSFWAFGLYRGQWRFVGLWDLFQLIKAVIASTLVCTTLFLFLYRFQGFSRIVFINDAMLTFLFIGGVRLLLRLFKEYFDMERQKKHTTPILIVGAGDGGDLFLRELRKNPNHDYLPVGFIDDDRAKRGQVIHGVKVIGTRNDIPEIVKRYGIKKIFLAIMSADDAVINDFQAISERIGVPCIKVPSLLPTKPPKIESHKRKGPQKVVKLRRVKTR